jgi:hypothetical protein
MGTNGSIKALMTHCRREVLHAQWSILLDDEFLEAYQHGIIIECCDGITRRFYPRILTYSADYPEKYALYISNNFVRISFLPRVLLASIRNKGQCPCPRCLIPMSHMQNLGMPRDIKQRETFARVDDEIRRGKVETARDIIYRQNYAVNGVAVEALLKEQSLMPTSVSLFRSIHIFLERFDRGRRTHSHEGLARLVSICFLCFSWTSCMNLSWAFGGPYLFIFCGFSTL